MNSNGRMCLMLLFIWAQVAVANSSAVKNLMTATQQGKRFDVLKLLQHVPSINSRDDKGRAAMHYAVIHKKFEILKILIDRGADRNPIDLEGKTPFDYYFDKHRFLRDKRSGLILSVRSQPARDIAQEFEADEITLDDTTDHPHSAIYTAMLFQVAGISGRNLIAEAILLGANPKFKNSDDQYPYHVAMQARHDFEVVAVLLKELVGKNGHDEKGWIVMNWAVLASNWGVLRELLRNGAMFSRRGYVSMQNPYNLAEYTGRGREFIALVKEEGRDDILTQLAEKGNLP